MEEKISIDFKSLSKSKHPFRSLYPFFHRIVEKFSLYLLLERHTRVKQELQSMELNKGKKELILCFWYRKVSIAFMIMVLMVFFTVVIGLREKETPLEGYKLYRDKNGEDMSLKLDVLIQGEETYVQSEETIPLTKREYKKEEFLQLIAEYRPAFENTLLSKNESLLQVTSDLYFPKNLFNTGIQIRWETEGEVIRNTGEVINEDLLEEKLAKVVAEFVYLDYVERIEFPVIVCPRVYTEEELLRKTWEDSMETAYKEARQEEYITLPEKVKEYAVSYQIKSQSESIKLLLLGILAVVVTWFLSDQEVINQNKKRQEKLLFIYPEIIQKLTLLVSAGMTVRGAFLKIVESKENMIVKGEFFIYEEIRYTLNEIRTGVNEAAAYEHMGRRIGLLPYLRLGSYLSQNLKKGSKGLIEQLTKEAVSTFEDRKNMARQLGEKAGTKLLLPMMVMLLIVLVITMYPAFASIAI